MTARTDLHREGGARIETGGLLVEVFTKPGGKPWLTYFIIAACTVIWAYLNIAHDSPYYQRVTDIIIPSGVAVWSGAYWGLLTCAFSHFDVWHILFNMWWLKDFGAILEPALGRPRYALLVITSAAVASGAELALADQTGIGFSGVIYAMFGYLLAARHTNPLYQQILSKQTIIWLSGWLLLCVVLAYAEVWRVANGAHIAGFAFGYCAGNAWAAKVRVGLNRIGICALILLAVLSATYVPWSETWKHRDAYALIFALRREAAAGNPIAQYKYAAVLLKNGRRADAVSWFRKSASRNYLPAMNGLAWTLATSLTGTLRNGPEAVQLAEKVCERTNWEVPQYLDTLAAAYAEVERWDDAVKTQRLAIKKLTGEDAKVKASFESRLHQYSKGQKERE